MGAPPFAAALASTFWGSLTSRLNPKILFLRGVFSHFIIILSMAFVTNLPTLLVLRLIQGIMGGLSTVGLIIVSSSTTSLYKSRDIGMYQNAMTLGQLIGPPIGAATAALLGYKGAFLCAAGMTFLILLFCVFQIKGFSGGLKDATGLTMSAINKQTISGWGLCFISCIQLMFLPSILPNVFQGFHMDEEIAVRTAGLVVMLYTGTAIIGTYLLSKMANRRRRRLLILTVGGVATAMQFLLSICPEIVSFVIVRMIQTAMIASVLPLVFSSFPSDLDGKVIGFLNSSRFAGNAMGPILATSIIAVLGLNWLYHTIAGLSVIALAGYAFAWKRDKKTK
jgi:DHA1 family multidrug resistance protein-like MFS transporter